MRKFLPLLAFVALAGCAGVTQSSWTKDVSIAQGAWTSAMPVINAAVQAKAPGSLVAVEKAEATVTVELVTLAAAPAPVSAQALVTDLQAMDAAIPAGTLSVEDQAIVAGVLTLAEVLVTDAGS
jgi:hypothetical protein